MNSLLAALFASALVVIQCYLSGSRLAFALPIYIVLALAGLLALGARASKISGYGKACMAATGLFFGYVIARAATSPNEYLARPDLLLALACVTTYLLTVFFITSRTDRMCVIWILFALVGVEAIIAARQFSYGDGWLPFGLVRADDGPVPRASGTFVNPAHLAGFLELVAPFALGIAFLGAKKIWVRLLAGYVAIICYFGIAVTGSRAGWICSIVPLLLFVVFSVSAMRKTMRSGFRMVLVLTICTAIALSAGAAYLMKQDKTLAQRMELLQGTPEKAVFGDMRFYNWIAAIEQWKESKWIGTGAGTHLYYARKHRQQLLQVEARHAHSDYLELLAEYGIAGVAGLVLLLGSHAMAGMKGYRRLSADVHEYNREPPYELALNIAALCAASAYAIHSMVDFNLHLPGNAITMAFIFGLLANPFSPSEKVAADDLQSEQEPRRKHEANFTPNLVLAALAGTIGIFSLQFLKSETFSEKSRVALRDAHWDEAITMATAAIERDTGNPYAYFHLGQGYRLKAAKLARVEQAPYLAAAEAAYRQALKLFPEEVIFWIRLGQTLDSQGNYKEARVAYDRAVALDPRQWMPRAYLSKHFGKIGDTRLEQDTWIWAQSMTHLDLNKYFQEPEKGPLPLE